MADRDKVRAALTAEAVAAHYQMGGTWRGRWMRSKRCPITDHSTDAFGLSRDGLFHCHACDIGGDLLLLIALAEGKNITTDFGAILELAAAIAGLVEDDDFGGGAPPAPARPAPPAIPPLKERTELAKRRAAFVWERLADDGRMVAAYLRDRGLDPAIVMAREDLRSAPIRGPWPERSSDDLDKLRRMFTVGGMGIPVRSITDGRMVDVRVRRYEPGPDQPKIIGMVGGVCRQDNELAGCYGRPHHVDSDLLVVVEGALDYLTALQIWPDAHILGAVDAGSTPLVAGFAAQCLAERDDKSRLLIVEQFDGERLVNGKLVAGAADRAINETCNAATKRMIRLLGPRRLGWLFCEPHKDLNDLHRAGGDTAARWWLDAA